MPRWGRTPHSCVAKQQLFERLLAGRNVTALQRGDHAKGGVVCVLLLS